MSAHKHLRRRARHGSAARRAPGRGDL